MLRYDPDPAAGKWAWQELPAGRRFGEISPLFRKLDPSIIAEERARIG